MVFVEKYILYEQNPSTKNICYELSQLEKMKKKILHKKLYYIKILIVGTSDTSKYYYLVVC